MRRILWGMFKKAVVADNCAMIADYAFGNHNLHGLFLLAGAFFYTIQIYADFSGYSDMAIGIAALLGFKTTRNFNYPYFAQNIAEFWRKWHISLTSWLTDYIFIPLSINFRDFGKWGEAFAIIGTFLISGLWHGANSTFVLWGLLFGCCFIPLIIQGKMNKKREIETKKIFPSFLEFINVITTFLIVMLLFVLFRSESLSQALQYYKNIFSGNFFHTSASLPHSQYFISITSLIFMFSIEWFNRSKAFVFENINKTWPGIVRWAVYFSLFTLSYYFMASNDSQNTGFIYLKF